MKKYLILLALSIPVSLQAQVQIGMNAGGALNAYDYVNKIGGAYKASVAYLFSPAVKAGIGYRRTNALDRDINSGFVFADAGGHIGQLEVYAGPEIGYFRYSGNLQIQYASAMRAVAISGFGIETGGHSGCNYSVSDFFALNAQIGYIQTSVYGRDNTVTTKQANSHRNDYYRLWKHGSFECCIGIRFTLRPRKDGLVNRQKSK